MLIVFCSGFSFLVVSMEQPESAKYWIVIDKALKNPFIGAVAVLQDNVPPTRKHFQRNYISQLRSSYRLKEQDKLKAISIAILKERTDILELLLSDGTDVRKTVSGVSLFKEYAGVETVEKVSWPLLCFAVFKKNREILSLLINKGACHRALSVESFDRLMCPKMGYEEVDYWHRLAQKLDTAQQDGPSINSEKKFGESAVPLGCKHDIKRSKTPFGCVLQ